ncbi:hypothetical protein EOL70_16005 [Leucothrix sargassi]|nr:hypothetical protein EOL70_16005 [Leucothrix sargassi]
MKRLQALVFSIGLSLSTSPLHSETLLGVFEGNQGWSMDKVETLEAWQDKKNAVVALYTGWSETSAQLLFDYQLPNIWQKGSVPLITWEPQFYESTPEDIETLIATGAYDDYIENWAVNLKQFLAGIDGVLGTEDDRRAYLRFAHEMNGNWYYWSALSGLNTPDDFITMWRRVWSIFEAQGIERDHLQWIWAVSASDHGDFTAEQYYPGDKYVDWVGIDGFNFGFDFAWSYWRTPEQVFEAMRHRLQKLASNKPLAIPEVSTTSMTEHGSNPFMKDEWISQFAEYVKTANVGLVSWFNLDKESDWKVFDGQFGAEEESGTRYYPAYKKMVADGSMIASNPNNPRIITDSQFKGEFGVNDEVAMFVKGCEMQYTITEQWKGGYVAKASLTANFILSDNWEVELQYPDSESVSYGWRARMSQHESRVLALAPSWWKWMPVDAMPDFGFVALGDGASPDHVMLDGVSCSISAS